MAYNVEFSEPIYDRSCDQWVISGFLELELDGQHYRTLTVKHWLSHEARYNQNWFRLARENIRRELEERANREMRSALQYRAPQPATFDRIAIPLIRRVYPQLIAHEIVGIQPMMGASPVLEFYQRWRHAETREGKVVRVPVEKFNWKEDGF